ncbi:MAG TPA: hypothetical protein VFQ23_12650 [Anaerolineales bacterium]|nr:hypothetical protein [Anaerolineales bacterium]
MNEKQCEQRLLAGTQKLDPVLNPLGFVFRISSRGISSPGPYAAGFYEKENKKIGLIYRSISGPGGLGAVIYEDGQVGVDHSTLMRYLGKKGFNKLRYDENRLSSYSYLAGGDVFDALAYDIQNFGVEFLTLSEDQFSITLKEARNTPEPEANPESKEASRRTQKIFVLIGLIILLMNLIPDLINSLQP